MALIVKDRVQETTITTGTGTLTLDGAVLGFQSFAAIGNGNTTYYAIIDPIAGDWEVGIGTYTASGTTLSRDTVLSSSSSGSLIPFALGIKNVFCTYPSERAVYLDNAGSYPVQNAFDTLTANTATLASGTVSQIPAVGTDIANKAYVDTTSVGLTIHEPVVAAATSNLTATYADGGTTPTWTTITNTSELATGSAHGLIAGAVIVFANVGASGLTAGTPYFVKSTPTTTSITLSLILDGPTITTLVNNTGYSITSRANSGVGATLTNAGAQVALVIDGVTLTATQRVLIQGQTSALQNGVYTVTNVGSGSTNWVLTRAADEDTYSPRSPDGAGAGDYFFVTSGNTSKGDSFVLSTSGTIVFGTTSLVFSQFSESNVYSAGTGLTLNNLVFSITNTGTAGTYGGANSVPVFTTNAQGQVTSVTPTSIAISAAAVSGLAASATTDTTNASNISSGTLGTSRLSGSYTGITGVGTLTAGTWNASTIAATRGGTGLTSFTAGDLIYANSSTTLAALADVAVGNALISGGVGADPSWGKIGLATHVSGTLPVANGGTGITSFGTGVATALGVNTGTAGAFVVNGAALGTPSSGTLTNATGLPLTTGVTGILPIANGGTGETTRQAAIDALAGAVTSGQYLRGNGTDVVMSAIQAADVPTLNQNTTGTASNVTGTVAVANGGTGATSLTANNVLLGNGTSGVQFVAPGTSGNVLISNGTTWTSAAAGGGIPAGTAMLFVQTNAPTGWTKSTTHDNKALRVVSGAASSGGSVAFTTAFASQAVNGSNSNTTATNQNTTAGGSVSTTLSVAGSVSATTLVESQMPSHTHAAGSSVTSQIGSGKSGIATRAPNASAPATSATGGNGSHTHGFTNPTYGSSFTGTAHSHTQDAHTHTFTGTAINLAVQYVDVIVATKD